MGTACSLCAPSAPPVQPLCNPCATLWESHCLTTVWLLCQGPFWNWFGILIHRIQGYWSTKSKMSLGYWSTAFFWSFCQGRFFFSGPVGRVPIKIFFCRGCQNLSRIKWVDCITSVFTHRSPRFRKLPSKTWPLWPDTLYRLSYINGLRIMQSY